MLSARKQFKNVYIKHARIFTNRILTQKLARNAQTIFTVFSL